MRLIAGQGIEGDSNADGFSPRQVLIVQYEDSRQFGIGPGELRENIVLTGLAPHLFAPGCRLSIGSRAQIRLTFHCEPCKRIGHLVPRYSDIIEKRGILGVVTAGGEVRIGDRVCVDPDAYSPLSPVAYERFLAFMAQVPVGRIVTYKRIVIGMGVASSYIRAIPRYIKQTASDKYPLHRIVDSEGNLISQYIPDQAASLLREGVAVIRDAVLFDGAGQCRVDIKKSEWRDASLYLK